MRFRQLLYQLPALIAVAFLFSGCTEERAVALKTAAELFDAGASAAIDAVVEL